MTRSLSNVYVITPHFPFSYPRDTESVQSSCTMEVLIPAGQTTHVKPYQSHLPSDTVLGVCGNSVHIALPQTVIESTFCTEMEDITVFTSDFQIRFYGTWMEEVDGAILQITGNALFYSCVVWVLCIMYIASVCTSICSIKYSPASKIYTFPFYFFPRSCA